ncbi:Predicted nuclease of the RNAse H fold, HicB family [Cohaesibacter marisflavi]|uniref:Predicted nuclease of the RNAse H fold, HicB family n=1 Tax=Cohaesibacter marisflavi TaxID=655353 RepID=A0A1I5H9U3_9HYPH|nr:type II toxin-antitoxin system HicB family antitoxin [Cohaesibacter marisflavi]SFO44959.1 Predicted nuclease of the RNAse H fold, HicB family [Cohaesibacter marisflavi]
MDYYIAEIEKDPDSTYGVSFPQLETVFSAGDSLDEAARNAAEALRLYFEDNPTERPVPWTMAEVVAIPDVQEDIHNGAVLVVIPYIEMTGRSVRANLTFDAGLLAAIDQDASNKNITRAAWLASAARTMLAG